MAEGTSRSAPFLFFLTPGGDFNGDLKNKTQDQ
ncbi:hypothetical protein OIU84_023489 [Salix udensis]|uniref:Uncharacterized protein n=1 Tax=Salix udensis TaxID=889485 RepID=A0AAD6PGC8_9ROSI|nr:hypothetical protein OIU84_023489 [Salix udensis]